MTRAFASLPAPAAPSMPRSLVRKAPLELVAHGDTAFVVPPKALRKKAYPLFAIQHAVVHVPRAERLAELRGWLAQHYVDGADWPTLWQDALSKNRICFDRYVIALLPERSRSLPAGDVVFKATLDFTHIPAQHLAQLSPSYRQNIQQAVSDAFVSYPGRVFYYLEPIFRRQAAAPVLATAAEVQDLAAATQASLARFCQRWGKLEAQRQRAKAEFAAWEAEWQRQQRRRALARQYSVPSQRLPPWTALLNPLGYVREQRTARLRPLDPVVAFAEPRWLLPCHPADTVMLRLVTHFDDDGFRCYLHRR